MQLPAELMMTCLVQLRTTDGEFLGTGFFAADRTVLTCAHVVSSIGSEIQVVWNEQLLAATIAELIPPRPGDGEFYALPDLASVIVINEISHPSVWLADQNPARHAPLTGMGFRLMQGLPGPSERDIGHDSVGLTVTGPSGGEGCLSVRGDGIVGGLSGSPVLDETTGRVGGLLKARRDDGIAKGGWVVPIETVRRYLPEVVAANQRLHPPASKWRAIVTDRAEWTIKLFGRATPNEPPPRPDAPPPSWWLDARNTVVPFRESAVFGELIQWCQADGADAALIRGVTAPGGTGKTRTGIELCRRLERQGWIAGLVRPELGLSRIRQSLPDVLRAGHPVLIAIDYAEGEIEEVRSLLDTLVNIDAHHVRVLLFARSIDRWLDGIVKRSNAEYLLEPRTVILPDIGSMDPIAVVADAMKAFYTAMKDGDITAPHGDLPAQLEATAQRHKRALDLHAIALTAVLSEVLGLDVNWSFADPIASVLEHERRYWERACKAIAEVTFSPFDELRDRALAVPTLYPAVEVAKARVVLGRVDGLEARTGGRVDLLAKALSTIYPSGKQSAWEPLQPDRLAETLIRDVLADYHDADAAAEQLATLLADVSPAQAIAPITILARLAALAGRVFDTRASRVARSCIDFLAGHRPYAFLPAITAISASNPDPGATVAIVLKHVGQADLPTIRETQAVLAQNYSVSAALTELAIALSRRAVALIEPRLIAPTAPPAVTTLDRTEAAGLLIELAREYHQLHEALHAAGQLKPAAEAAQRACTLLRALAEDGAPKYRSDLAAALSSLGQTLARSGHYTAGVAKMRESVEIYRALYQDDPRTANDLARALVNLATFLPDTNQRAAAVDAAREAVSIRTELAARDDSYTVALISSLHTLATQLGNAGQFNEALSFSTRAYDEATGLDPRHALRHPELLADVAHDHSHWLAKAGRLDEAATITGEAVALYELLHQRHPERYRYRLAMSLMTLSDRQRESGDPHGALRTLGNSMTIIQRFGPEDSSHAQLYAGALINSIQLYRELYDFSQAVEIGEQAVRFCRHLTDIDEAANFEYLVQALMALGGVCDSCLRLTDAVRYAEEAASIQRRNFRLDVPSSVMSYTGTLRNAAARLDQARPAC